MINGVPARHLAAVAVAFACLVSACAPAASSASPSAPPASDRAPTPSTTPVAAAPDATTGPTSMSPAPSAPPGSRAPIAPPGSIITADIRDDDGLVARLRAWSPAGQLVATIEAPFELEDGWYAPSPVVAAPDGRLAIYATRHRPKKGEAVSVEGTAVVDVVDPEARPIRVFADEWDPAWTASGDFVTRFSGNSSDQFLRRTQGLGDPISLADTPTIDLAAVSDRPDAALIGVAWPMSSPRDSHSPDDAGLGFYLVPWQGPAVEVDKPPTPMLTTGVERITSTAGDRIDTEVLEGSGEEKSVVAWLTADGRRFGSDLVGDEGNGWFNVAWTRAGVDALATSRDRVHLLALRDGKLDERVLARLPDLGRGHRWFISAATDDQVVLRGWEQDRTGIVSLVDDGEPVRWIDGVPVGVIPD